MYFGSALAVLASTLLTVGLYFLKREVERLPRLDGGRRWRALWAFVRDPWWVLGVALQTLGYAVYLLALRSAPLSIVHTMLNGGIVFFVILSVVGLGERVRTVEWVGVSIVTAALIVLSASLSADSVSSSPAHGMLPFSLVLLALSALAILVDPAPGRAVGLSIATGLLLGAGSVYAKTLATASALGTALGSVYFPLTLGANIVGFVLMQAALQAGRGVVVMPLFSTLSNLVPIVGGIFVFGESLPDRGVAVILRPLAFVLALTGAALLAGFGERAARDATPVSVNPTRSGRGS